MPGSPRDNTDALLRELRDLRREVERLKRHRHPIGRNTADPTGTGLTDFGGFGRGSTQSMTDGGTTAIQLDSVSNDGNTCLALNGTDLEFLLQGVYLVSVEAVGPSMTANGDFLLTWSVLMANASTANGSGDRRITSSAVTTRPTPKACALFAVDAGAVATFAITQTSGSNRNFTLNGHTWRLGPNDNLVRTATLGTF